MGQNRYGKERGIGRNGKDGKRKGVKGIGRNGKR